MELSTKATEINGVTCNYGNCVSICLHRFAVNSIQTLYLENMLPGGTISGSTCCLRKLVAMETENYFHYFDIWRIINFILGRHTAFRQFH